MTRKSMKCDADREKHMLQWKSMKHGAKLDPRSGDRSTESKFKTADFSPFRRVA